MMKGSILLAFILLAAGCGKSDLPKDLLPPDKMQAVYWDYLKADIFVNEFVRRDSTRNLETESARYQNQVFQLHKTDRKQFYSSYNYYMHHPELMKPLLDSMIEKGQNENKLRDTINAKKQQLLKGTDSNNIVQ